MTSQGDTSAVRGTVGDETTYRCRGCGYVLDGLPAEGECPECGRVYAFADPETVRSTPPLDRRDTLRPALKASVLLYIIFGSWAWIISPRLLLLLPPCILPGVLMGYCRKLSIRWRLILVSLVALSYVGFKSVALSRVFALLNVYAFALPFLVFFAALLVSNLVGVLLGRHMRRTSLRYREWLP
ncbi:MAG: hypothetical protein KDA21_05265 [Phycisphaerales bacterium]|nr:hypothetical protein [Phycisphaerales bacterium]